MAETTQNKICIPQSSDIKDSLDTTKCDELDKEDEMSPEEIAMMEMLEVVSQRFAFYSQKGTDPLTTVLNVSEELNTYLKEDYPDKNAFHNKAAKVIIDSLFTMRWEIIDQNQHYR